MRGPRRTRPRRARTGHRALRGDGALDYVWRRVVSVLDAAERVAPRERRALYVGQPEHIRRLIVLCALEPVATTRAIDSKLNRE